MPDGSKQLGGFEVATASIWEVHSTGKCEGAYRGSRGPAERVVRPRQRELVDAFVVAQALRQHPQPDLAQIDACAIKGPHENDEP